MFQKMRTKEGRSQPKNNESGKDFLDRWTYTFTPRETGERHTVRGTHQRYRNGFSQGRAVSIKPRKVMIGMLYAEGFKDVAIVTRRLIG